MMSISTFVRFASAAVLLTLLSACASAPETGRSQILLIDQAQEAKLGFQTFEQMKRKTPYDRNGQQ